MNEPPTAAPQAQPADERGLDPAGAVQSLVRLHNLMVFIVFVGGLASAAVLQVRRGGLDDGLLRRSLLIARVALPVLALLVTAAYTHRRVQVWHRRHEGPARPEQITAMFAASKRVSILLLTGCGLFADACLMFGNRMIDLLLALGTLGLLIVTRPSLKGLAAFTLFFEPDESSTITSSDRPT